MPEHVVDAATVDPRPTAVVAQATTWEEYRGLWPRLLDEVYAFVRRGPPWAARVRARGGRT